MPDITQQVRAKTIERRTDTPTNYRKHTLFALVLAFTVQLIADPQRALTAFIGPTK